MIIDVFEKHTLFNKLVARRRFYTASMNEKEKELKFASRILKLAGTLKSMRVTFEDSEMVMSLLNGLSDLFDGVIGDLNALGNEQKLFTLDFVKSRCQQEEQHYANRDQGTQARSDNAALFAYLNLCVHCGNHNNSNRRYQKYPNLDPLSCPRRISKALFLRQRSSKLTSSESTFPEGSSRWFMDSGCTSQMKYDGSAFASYHSVPHSTVDLSDD